MLWGRYRTCWLRRHWSGEANWFCQIPGCFDTPGTLLHIATGQCPSLAQARKKAVDSWLLRWQSTAHQHYHPQWPGGIPLRPCRPNHHSQCHILGSGTQRDWRGWKALLPNQNLALHLTQRTVSSAWPMEQMLIALSNSWRFYNLTNLVKILK